MEIVGDIRIFRGKRDRREREREHFSQAEIRRGSIEKKKIHRILHRERKAKQQQQQRKENKHVIEVRLGTLSVHRRYIGRWREKRRGCRV